MKIHDNRPPAIQPGQAPATPVPAVAPAAGEQQGTPPEARRARRDSLELSPAALAHASGEAAPAPASLGPARLAEIRERIHSGAYDSFEALDEVARRILDRGDL